VLSLRFAGGLSIEETAKAMGKSPGAIKALQHAAVLSLRKLLVVEQDGAVETN
jgi:RNA polymerase sigma-70 factor, ECF subfamily